MLPFLSREAILPLTRPATILRARAWETETKAFSIILTTALCEKFGIFDLEAKEHGLRFWEEAGIFTALRKLGKKPRVELVQPLKVAAGVKDQRSILCNAPEIRLSCSFG